MFDISDLTPQERVLRARIQMYQKSPFFAYILLNMKLHEDKEGKHFPPWNRTMAVDANGNMYWAEEFVKKITENELMGVIAHEVMHIALLHLERGKGKDRQLFNVANDLIVNDILLDDGFKLPKEGCIPERHDHSFTIFGKKIEKINEKSSEEIYDELYEIAPKVKFVLNMMGGGKGDGGESSQGEGEGEEDGDGQSGGSGKGDKKGKNQKPEGMSNQEIQEAKQKLEELDTHIYGSNNGEKDDGENGEGQGGRMRIDRMQGWKKIIAEAAQLAKQQGKLPAGLERRIEGVLDSKMNWKQRLYKYVVSQIIYDYSWNRPHKRGMGLGVYLPDTVKESVHIVVSIDTSGSIGGNELQEFLSELIAIGNSFVNIKMDIIICDAAVHETYQLTRDNVDDIMSMKISGGGGTSHIPVYDYVKENIHDCKVLINFTDGYTSFPEDPEDHAFESLWVLNKHSCDEKDVPFGEVIKLE